jgi:DNA-binding HxlR family transcriptional regulator
MPSSRRSDCPIGIALDILGDRWTLLILRDLMLRGIDSFGGLLASPEGIATSTLSERLNRLETGGIVSRRPDQRDKRRQVYALTEKGIDLAPVLIDLIIWSARHEDTDVSRDQAASMDANRDAMIAQIAEGWRARRAAD